jgi:hypothetical protein
MPAQLTESGVQLLCAGEQLWFGKKSENLAAVEVVSVEWTRNGPTRVCVRFLQDFDRGSSWWKAGAETNAHVGDLWVGYCLIGTVGGPRLHDTRWDML